MEKYKILVAGAGGVGGYLTYILEKSGFKPYLLARGENLEAIKRDGLKIINNQKEEIIHPNVNDSFDESLKFDLIIITTKSYSLKELLKNIKKNIKESSIILPILNGIEIEKKIQKEIKATVIKGCIYIISHLIKPATIKKEGDVFKLCIEDKNLELINNIFKKLPIRVKITKDIDLEIWRKFLFISPMAALTSLYNIPMDQVYKRYPLLFEGMLKEIKEVANSIKVPINNEDIKRTIKGALNVKENTKTSMQLDLEKGKESEFETLIEPLLEIASKNNIELSIYPQIYKELKEKYEL